MLSTDPDAAGRSITGRFWVAGSEERQADGELTFADDGPSLRLTGMLTPAWRESPSAHGQGTTTISLPPGEDDESLTVHGIIGGTRVTLVDTFTSGRSWNLVMRDPYAGEHRLTARYAVTGAHVDGLDERYTAVRMRTHHLDEWMRLPGFGYSQPGETTPASITHHRVGVPSVPLHNGGTLGVEQVVTTVTPTARGGALERTVWLCATDVPAARWDALDRHLVTPLSALLTLATDTDCPVAEVEVTPHGAAHWCAVHRGGVRPAAASSFSAHDELLPWEMLGLPGLAQWLDRVEMLGVLPSVVAENTAGAPQALEAQALVLTTVAEGLARRLWPDRERVSRTDAEDVRARVRDALVGQADDVTAAVQGALSQLHEPSYPQRLLALAERAAAVAPDATGRLNDAGTPSRWKNAVVDTRNELAHQLDRGWLDETRLHRYLTVITSLRWLLTAVLLLQAGIAPDKLAERFKQHDPYHRLFLNQARDWLPDVYGSTSDDQR